MWLTPDKSGGLNGSTQHQFEVYFSEFRRPSALAGVESRKTPSYLGPIKGSPKDRSLLKSIVGTSD
jgi:hypothetical protein